MKVMFGKSEAKKSNRFEAVYTQSDYPLIQIWVDRETGVNYLFTKYTHGGGVTPLLDSEGKPVVTKVKDE